MASRNDITGDIIATKGTSESYRNNYDAIFRKKTEAPADPYEERARRIYNQHCEIDAELPAWSELSPPIREAFIIAAMSELAAAAPAVVVKEVVVVKEELPVKTDKELAQELRGEQTRKWWTYIERSQHERKAAGVSCPSFVEFRDTILPTLNAQYFDRT